jgi:cytosine/adenosine deaminase-related metal-dependent hydrolase
VGDTVTAIERAHPCNVLDDGALVVIPGLVNGHTHLGDCAFPDGAAGLTLEESFFRPDGYKYRELARLPREAHRTHLEGHLRYLARTGTVCHLDFREQGAAGAALLREASRAVGVHSVILNQFDTPPFDAASLAANTASLPQSVRAELSAMLDLADGFSESTMNDLTDPAWREIRELTEARGKLRAIHCLENDGYRTLSLQRTGRGDLAQALELFDPQLIVHLTAANNHEIAALAASGKTAALNPRANASLGLGLPPIAALLEAGVNLLLGTDNVMLNSPNLFAELDFAAKLARSQAGDPRLPDPAAMLRMVSVNAAAVLGADYPGQLDVRLPASFVVLDFNALHLRSSRNVLASLVGRVTPTEVLATVRHGEILWQDDRLDLTA